MSATSGLCAALLATHLLSVAAWFGAPIYRTFVVDVRSSQALALP